MGQKLYRQVFDTIVQRIVSGRYAPGTMLPAAPDLGAEFGVSPGTIRTALNVLEQKKIINRQQGKGTFVRIQTPETSLFHFFKLHNQDGEQVVPNLVDQRTIRRRAKPGEREILFGAPRDVFEIERRRTYKGKLISHETSVVSTDLFPGLIDRAPLPNTLYVLFQQAYSCAIIQAKDDLTAEPASEEIALELDIKPGTPVLVSRRKAFDLLDRVVELRQSVFVTKNIHYSITMT